MTVLKYLFAVLVTLPILFLGVFLMKRYSIELRKTNQNAAKLCVFLPVWYRFCVFVLQNGTTMKREYIYLFFS